MPVREIQTVLDPIKAQRSYLSDRSWVYLKPLLNHLTPYLQFIAPDRRGCVISNSKFGLDYFDRHYSEVIEDRHFRDEVVGHSLARKSSQLLDLQGPCLSIASACATGLHNIIFGAQRILDGEADVMVCGAAEASKVPVIEAAFKNMGVVSQRGLCTPFDKDRDGFVMGEGAGVCLLRREGRSAVCIEWAMGRWIDEQNESESRRVGEPESLSPFPRFSGSPVQILIKGWGMTNDSTHPIHFHPSGEAIAVAIEKALRMAGLRPSDVDLIYAHGTGTRLNDQIEANALRAVFGSDLPNIPVTSTKGMTGHLLGAAGAVELALACEMLATQSTYPTHCSHKDDEFSDLFVIIQNSKLNIQNLLKLNYGFGGQIAAIVLARA